MRELKIFIILFTVFIVLASIGAFVAIYTTLVTKRRATNSRKQQSEREIMEKIRRNNIKRPLNTAVDLDNGYIENQSVPTNNNNKEPQKQQNSWYLPNLDTTKYRFENAIQNRSIKALPKTAAVGSVDGNG